MLGRLVWSNVSLLVVIVLIVAGCEHSPQPVARPTATYPGVSLKVGAIGDATILAAVTLERGEWEASRKGTIQVREEPIAPQSLNDVDVVLFPADRLGDLVDAGVLATIPNEAVLPPRPSEYDAAAEDRPARPDESSEAPDDPFQYMDIAPAFRELVSRYGPERIGLPCGGTALVLVYRRDALEKAANRDAARQAGISLDRPPTTWTQLDALARFFQGRDWNGDGKPDHGIALALGSDAERVADATFLARAASLGLHRDHYSLLFDSESMAPRVATPPFVEAIAGLIALKNSGPPGVERFDAAAAREAFRTGKVALLIDRAERASTWSHGKPLGVAPLPGSERVFEPIRGQWTTASTPNLPVYLPNGGGWLVGMSRQLTGERQAAALDLVKYLTNPENANRLRSERSFPMLPVRSSLMGQGLPDPLAAPDVDGRLWADAVSRTLQAERVVPGLRIPDTGGYLDDLTKGRVAALAGEPPAQALAAVVKAWSERTRRLGPKHQLWHYRRSLNSLTTSSTPPPAGQ